MRNIAIFASGSGTNAENIIKYFADNNQIKVKLILSNKKDAYVIQRAINHQIEWIVFNRHQFYESDFVLQILKIKDIDAIVLAGFLWLIPDSLIKAYPDKIINIHPALLPKYGGKGMYGMHVHKAVIENKETESGITIHYVNEKYDEGKILFNAKCKIEPGDTAESLAEKIHELEYKHFPGIIESWLKSTN
jgi:phosphoribosylglycinamide formyltransferase-1